jgi:hypothetical protein
MKPFIEERNREIISECQKRVSQQTFLRPPRPCPTCSGMSFITRATGDWSMGALLQAFICRSCGRTELFHPRPDSIPVGEEYGNILVDYDSGVPYR